MRPWITATCSTQARMRGGVTRATTPPSRASLARCVCAALTLLCHRHGHPLSPLASPPQSVLPRTLRVVSSIHNLRLSPPIPFTSRSQKCALLPPSPPSTCPPIRLSTAARGTPAYKQGAATALAVIKRRKVDVRSIKQGTWGPCVTSTGIRRQHRRCELEANAVSHNCDSAECKRDHRALRLQQRQAMELVQARIALRLFL